MEVLSDGSLRMCRMIWYQPADERRAYLEHRGDTAATSNHSDSVGSAELRGLRFVQLVENFELAMAKVSDAAFWSKHFNSVADAQRFQILSDLSSFGKLRMNVFEINFDQEIKVANIVVTRNGGVRP